MSSGRDGLSPKKWGPGMWESLYAIAFGYPDNPTEELRIGSYGSEDGQFYYPTGVAVDGQGNVYVADTNNHVIRTIDLASDLRVATLDIDGLEPPETKKEKPKPSFPGAKRIKLKPQLARPDAGKLKLRIQLKLPTGWKIRSRASPPSGISTF